MAGTPDMDQAINDLQDRLNHRFANSDLLRAALTHSSTGAAVNYERLEFLGDRVLGLVLARFLFDTFPHESEGDLARRHAALVSGTTLALVAQAIDLGAALHLSHSERAAGGAENDNILSDVIEAIIGALYLDAGLDPCVSAIESLWGDLLQADLSPPRDPKTALQEWAQGRGHPLPRYTMIERSGPDHAPIFTVSVFVEGFDEVAEQGPSRRTAEKAAATRLLDIIEKDNRS
ncbi:ribonuclease III [Micavibrio aeruginosavorus]|uniref:ribonuclease III n=1 Tax=Micavibrio aeruginosavorus TaxID=349221 RepID=UPI003F4AC29D